jgi:hypothetical protein
VGPAQELRAERQLQLIHSLLLQQGTGQLSPAEQHQALLTPSCEGGHRFSPGAQRQSGLKASRCFSQLWPQQPPPQGLGEEAQLRIELAAAAHHHSRGLGRATLAAALL